MMKTTKKSQIKLDILYGYWKVIEVTANRRIPCYCMGCNNNKIKLVSYLQLLDGTSRSCGCQAKRIQQETLLQKYGVDSYAKTEEYKKRFKETMLSRYGVERALQNPIFLERAQQTTLERFGVKNASQDPNTRKRAQQTTFERFGVISFSQLDKEKIRRRALSLEKFGVTNPLNSKESRLKQRISLQKNGTIKTSKPQFNLYSLLKMSGYSVELNAPIGTCNADILLTIEDTFQIDIEFDGGGHFVHQPEKQIAQQDRKRDEFIKSQGYSILRIESKKDRLPTIQQIEEALDKFNSNAKFQKLIIS